MEGMNGMEGGYREREMIEENLKVKVNRQRYKYIFCE